MLTQSSVATLSEDFKLVFSDNMIAAQEEAKDLVSDCQKEAKKLVSEANGSADAALEAMQLMATCVESKIARSLERANEEIAFQASVRKGVASQLENYTCVDASMTSSDDLETHVWEHHDGIKRTVHVKHDRPASKIHFIEDFITEEECEAMAQSAAPKLHKATVADGSGGSRMSEARKAMQAGIKVDWDKEGKNEGMESYIAGLSRRVYDYTNHVLGLNIEHYGQEDLMSIQYFGRGTNDTEPDRYSKFPFRLFSEKGISLLT
jgi:hypothetical protein